MVAGYHTNGSIVVNDLREYRVETSSQQECSAQERSRHHWHYKPSTTDEILEHQQQVLRGGAA